MVLIYFFISESGMRALGAAGAYPSLAFLQFSTLELQFFFFSSSLGLITVVIMKIILAPGVVLIYTINIAFYA